MKRVIAAAVLCLPVLTLPVAARDFPAPAGPEVQTRESQAAMTPTRAPIEIVFDQGIGHVFGVRVAGSVVNDDEVGSLEYAVKGAIDGVQLGNLTGLLAKIHPAVEAAGCNDAEDEACVTRVAEKNVRQSKKAIRERSPYLVKYLDEGKVGLVGALYDVATGKVTFLEDRRAGRGRSTAGSGRRKRP